MHVMQWLKDRTARRCVLLVDVENLGVQPNSNPAIADIIVTQVVTHALAAHPDVTHVYLAGAQPNLPPGWTPAWPMLQAPQRTPDAADRILLGQARRAARFHHVEFVIASCDGMFSKLKDLGPYHLHVGSHQSPSAKLAQNASSIHTWTLDRTEIDRLRHKPRRGGRRGRASRQLQAA